MVTLISFRHSIQTVDFIKFLIDVLLKLSVDVDLDLDSTRIQVDALGHTPTPFLSVKSCHLCFFPGERHLSQIFLD